MLTIVLVRPQHPGNIGFIARVMANFDVKGLVVVDPLSDLIDEDSAKKSKHAKKILENAAVKR